MTTATAKTGAAPAATARKRRARLFLLPTSPRPGALEVAVGLMRAMRPLHWAKNALVFVPLLEGHHTRLLPTLRDTYMAFVAFCLCASSAYVINDLLDVEADRRHPTKRWRPFAAGRITAGQGLGLAAILVALGMGAGTVLPPAVLGTLVAYWLGTLAYSLILRRFEILDVVVLAGFFTLRLLAGALVSGEPISPWFFAMSTFAFFSLALLKRTNELRILRSSGAAESARGYRTADLEPLVLLGSVSGVAAVLFLAAFICSAEAHLLYAHPLWLWPVVPLSLYWIARIWLLAYRGQVDEDPVVFALRDRVSYAIAILAVATTAAGLW